MPRLVQFDPGVRVVIVDDLEALLDSARRFNLCSGVGLQSLRLENYPPVAPLLCMLQVGHLRNSGSDRGCRRLRRVHVVCYQLAHLILLVGSRCCVHSSASFCHCLAPLQSKRVGQGQFKNSG